MNTAGGRTSIQNLGLAVGVAALLATLVSEPPAGVSPDAWHVGRLVGY